VVPTIRARPPAARVGHRGRPAGRKAVARKAVARKVAVRKVAGRRVAVRKAEAPKAAVQIPAVRAAARKAALDHKAALPEAANKAVARTRRSAFQCRAAACLRQVSPRRARAVPAAVAAVSRPVALQRVPAGPLADLKTRAFSEDQAAAAVTAVKTAHPAAARATPVGQQVPQPAVKRAADRLVQPVPRAVGNQVADQRVQPAAANPVAGRVARKVDKLGRKEVQRVRREVAVKVAMQVATPMPAARAAADRRAPVLNRAVATAVAVVGQ
jgi:hypothetical protein